MHFAYHPHTGKLIHVCYHSLNFSHNLHDNVNITHVHVSSLQHILRHLNLQPKDSHGVDFSRVRMWSINGWSKYYRQTLVIADYPTPEINSVFNKNCFNILLRVVKVVHLTLVCTYVRTYICFFSKWLHLLSNSVYNNCYCQTKNAARPEQPYLQSLQNNAMYVCCLYV